MRLPGTGSDAPLLTRIGRLLLSLLVPPRGHRTRPTVSGWLLILVAIGLGAAAYNTASNILFLVLSFLLSLLILNGVLSVINFRRIEWRIVLPERFEEGKQERIFIELRNGKRWLPTLAVWFRVTVEGQKPQQVFLSHRLEPGTVSRLEATVCPGRRGKIRIELSGVESTFPFGFLIKRIGFASTHERVVWPARRREMPTLPLPVNHRQPGEASRRGGSGTDLLQLRPYTAGDPLKLVHWKATARTGRMVIRQMAEEGNNAVALLWDDSSLTWRSAEAFDDSIRAYFTAADDLFRKGRLRGYQDNDGTWHSIQTLADLCELKDRLALAEAREVRPHQPVTGRPLIRFFPEAKGGLGAVIAGYG